MKSKNAVYKNIMSELNPLWVELDKIETELKLMWEFDGVDVWSEHETKTHKRAVILRREIAWWESELEEVA